MARHEILVIGDGVAGLRTAGELVKKGHQVTLINGGKPPGYRPIYTTFAGPGKPYTEVFRSNNLLPLDKLRIVTEKTNLLINAPGYTIVNYAQALDDLRGEGGWQECGGDTNLPVHIKESADGVEINYGGEQRRAEYVVDASGQTHLSQPDPNRICEYIYGGVFAGQLREAEMVIAFIQDWGGTCWANPNIKPGFVDILFTGWGSNKYFPRFIRNGENGLTALKNLLIRKGVFSPTGKGCEQLITGTISSQAMRKTSNRRIFTVGEAGNMGIPKTNDLFRFSLIGADVTAKAIDEGGGPNEVMKRIYQVRPRYKDKLLEAATYQRLTHQAGGRIEKPVDKLQTIINQRPELARQAEEFFVGTKFPLSLFAFILKEPSFREIMFGSVAIMAAQAILGTVPIAEEYPFPLTHNL